MRVQIEVPRNLSGKQKEALKNFDATMNEKNYEKRKSFFDRFKDMAGKVQERKIVDFEEL